MNFFEYKFLVKSDLYRYCGNSNLALFVRMYAICPGFKYSFLMRSAIYIKQKAPLKPLYYLLRLVISRLQYKYGISIPYNTKIGSGLYIGHFGGIVVSSDAEIGKNCNINHGVTIGATYGGKSPGVPRIGDNVYIGPGSFVIGGIVIGNDVAIGANTLVNKSIPDEAVVVGSPGGIISYKGSGAYIVNTNY